jgi:hypothetical protein
MAATVAPLTTTVMAAVDPHHAGAASGVNNAVSRVAGLLAIAVFGVAMARTFDARVGPQIDRLNLPSPARAELDEDLEKIAGADPGRVGSLPPSRRGQVRAIVDDGFVAAFRMVMVGSAVLALGAAGCGAAMTGRADHPTPAR